MHHYQMELNISYTPCSFTDSFIRWTSKKNVLHLDEWMKWLQLSPLGEPAAPVPDMGPSRLRDLVVLANDSQYWAVLGTYSVGFPLSSVFFPLGLSNTPGAVNHKASHSLLQRTGPHSQIPGAHTTTLPPGPLTTECVGTPVPTSPAHFKSSC